MKQFQSESIKNIATALAKVQGEMEHAKKAEDNPYFKSKYADLPAVIDVARKLLASNGLSVTQLTDVDDNGKISMVTQLMHSSGEWIRGYYPVNPVKNDPQNVGSAVTYARRYSFCAITGVAAIGEDDDGNKASGVGEKEPEQKGVFGNPKELATYTENSIRAIEKAKSQDELKDLRELEMAKRHALKQSPLESERTAYNQIIQAQKDRLTAIRAAGMINDEIPF